ncbi:HlyD family type I secretion periplasmic adaptor subunit [Chitinilyticum litopenaei]|uniref:HlyD family type I secretion periplasmic adaptor subunit n=1 Tax=Chitinilyticum litopenaei TaxID=1121276 RepID=UPI00041FD5C2|nr:HlyD family type I secretion periplasmic adaptor subunit [Chitinilyticum litopenaei]
MKNWLKKIQGLSEADAGAVLAQGRPPTDANKVVRAGVLALVLGFGGFLVWATFAQLDEGVPAPGVVSVDSKRKAIQHLQGGIVKQIMVRDGDLVKADQPLLQLDQTQTAAMLSTVRTNYWQMQAMSDRLQAEQLRAPKVTFNQRLIDSAKTDPKVQQVMDAQQQLFESRRSAYTNQRQILAQSAAAAEEQVRGLRALEVSRARQIALLEKDIAGLRSLVDEGFAPRSRLFELERMLAQLNGERSTTLSDIERASRMIAEARLRSSQVEQDFMKEVDTQLTQVQGELNRWSNELRSREEEMDRTVLRSPAVGRVVGLNVHTVGGVIKPGEVLMEIVPEDDKLVVEAQLPTHLIDKVHAGLEAEVRFASLGTRGQVPVLNGELASVSADRIVDSRGYAYYLANIHVKKESLAELSKMNLKIQPGMPADIVIKTGERSLLDYLMRPLMNHLAPAMKEH